MHGLAQGAVCGLRNQRASLALSQKRSCCGCLAQFCSRKLFSKVSQPARKQLSSHVFMSDSIKAASLSRDSQVTKCAVGWESAIRGLSRDADLRNFCFFFFPPGKTQCRQSKLNRHQFSDTGRAYCMAASLSFSFCRGVQYYLIGLILLSYHYYCACLCVCGHMCDTCMRVVSENYSCGVNFLRLT